MADLRPKTLRTHVLNMAFHGKTVHVACAFSLVEILSVLFDRCLKFNPRDPNDPNRDYLVLSKGHGVMALYACLHELGWVSREDFGAYMTDGSLLHGLAESGIPGVEVSSGSLGHGLPVAAGMALGLKRLGRTDRRVFCIVGDGELNEGTVWETLMFAGHHRLGNLAVIVDANGQQAMGDTRQILDTEPLVAKFKSFGLQAAECDGHDVKRLADTLGALRSAAATSELPQGLVARTVKGKGVSFMEGDNRWHYTRLDADTLAQSLAEIAKSA